MLSAHSQQAQEEAYSRLRVHVMHILALRPMAQQNIVDRLKYGGIEEPSGFDIRRILKVPLSRENAKKKKGKKNNKDAASNRGRSTSHL